MKFPGPTYRLSFACENGAPDQRIAGRHFRLDHRCLGDFFLTNPLPLLDDLLRISTSAYVIDRLVKRRGQANWPRSLRMSLEVAEPHFWTSSHVHTALVECLEFVSGDCWEIDFEKANRGGSDYGSFLGYRDLFAGDQPLVCLNSGGLDSVAGLVRRIRECPGRPVLPVTVWHQPRQRSLIRQQLRVIKEKYGAQITPVVVKAALLGKSKSDEEERSQRCRAFLFAAVGGVVAIMHGVSSIEVFESGIGAINLPLMAGMVGSKATRSSHPEFLRLMARLVSLVAEREVTFHAPFLDRTKGEMVKLLADEALHHLARQSVSCVHYPLRESPHKQCGICPACIFRRQAMFVAGIEEPKNTYKFDLSGQARFVNRIPEKCLEYLKAFLMQLVHLAALDSQDKLPRRLQRHLIGTGIVGPTESPLPVIELVCRYRKEWLPITAEGERRGWSWVKLLTPTVSPKQEGLSHASA